MATISGAQGPRAGDVVIARHDASAETYRLHVFEGATQLLFYNRDDAVRDAMTFAEIHQVDVWYTSDGERYQRAGTHRRPRRSGASATY